MEMGIMSYIMPIEKRKKLKFLDIFGKFKKTFCDSNFNNFYGKLQNN